jgi:hypothetical protein
MMLLLNWIRQARSMASSVYGKLGLWQARSMASSVYGKLGLRLWLKTIRINRLPTHHSIMLYHRGKFEEGVVPVTT